MSNQFRARRTRAGVAAMASLSVLAAGMWSAPSGAEVPSASAEMSCTGGETNPNTHPETWTVGGAARTFYVGESAKELDVLVNHTFPAQDVQKMRAGAGGIGQMEAWFTPRVDLNGTPVSVARMHAAMQKLPNAGGTTRNFSGPLLTLPSQTVPGDLVVGVSGASVPTEQWLAGGNVKSAGREFLYNCNTSTGNSVPVAKYTVKAKSTTVVDVSPTSGIYPGEAARATATVTVTGGTAEGVVKFGIGNRVVEGQVNAEGKATAVIPSDIAPGTHTVTATFVPDDVVHYDGSVSSPSSLKVKAPFATETALSVPSTTVGPGESVDLSVLVTSSEGTPAGEVQVSVGARTETRTLDNGSASIDLGVLPMGVHDISAAYLPAVGAHTASQTLAPTRVTVRGRSSVQLEQPLPVVEGSRGTLRATVTGEGGDTTGVVKFRISGETVEANVVDGVATAESPLLVPASYPVTAEYVPAAGVNLAGATSDGKDLLVSARQVDPVDPVDPTTPGGGGNGTVARSTTLTLTPSHEQFRYGQATSVTASLGQASAGTVVFTVDGRTETVPVTSGQATFDLRGLKAGGHVVAAVFRPADAAAWRSSSASTQVTVVRDNVLAKVRAKRNAKKVVKGVVTLSSANGTAVNGTVRVKIAGKGIKKRTVTLRVVNGKATVKLKKVALARYKLKVVWAGNADLNRVKVVATSNKRGKAVRK